MLGWCSRSMTEAKLVLFGFGNVGRALARLLVSKRDELHERYDLTWKVVGIATASHGAAIDFAGIDLERALALADSGETLEQVSKHHPVPTGPELIEASQADVLFENTPVNYASGQPAIDHLRAALKAGMHAITANKGPVVHAYHHLTDLARRHDRQFLFEAAVMDGAPIFSLWRTALPAARLRAFRGILNSTTNLILTLMERGETFDAAVTHAQAIGIAESDPRGDTQGWDAAIKVAALATVLMGTPLKPNEVERKGIEDLSKADIAACRAEGKRWKLVCRAERDGRDLRASVQPERVGPSDPLYGVMGTSSAISFETDVLGTLMIRHEDSGPETTAYGLLADFTSAVRAAH